MNAVYATSNHWCKIFAIQQEFFTSTKVRFIFNALLFFSLKKWLLVFLVNDYICSFWSAKHMSDFSIFFPMGIEHITDLNGIDHILFIAALCLRYLINDWKKLLLLVTAFTIGHSVTLALSTLNVIEKPKRQSRRKPATQSHGSKVVTLLWSPGCRQYSGKLSGF